MHARAPLGSALGRRYPPTCTSNYRASRRVAQLPLDSFPPAGSAPYAESALFGRSERRYHHKKCGVPKGEPCGYYNRLRLDRYDEDDFVALRSSMVKDGLWLDERPVLESKGTL